MKYFKYIVILILLAITSLLYIQLDDYNDISSSLLNDNIETKEKIKQLEDSIKDVEIYSSELQTKIDKLYTIIDTRELEIELLEETCIEKPLLREHNITQLLTPNNNTTIEIKPKITLDNENEVTGFE